MVWGYNSHGDVWMPSDVCDEYHHKLLASDNDSLILEVWIEDLDFFENWYQLFSSENYGNEDFHQENYSEIFKINFIIYLY